MVLLNTYEATSSYVEMKNANICSLAKML